MYIFLYVYNVYSFYFNLRYFNTSRNVVILLLLFFCLLFSIEQHTHIIDIDIQLVTKYNTFMRISISIRFCHTSYISDTVYGLRVKKGLFIGGRWGFKLI